MSNRLMCHVVAGYPNPADCVALLLAMQQAGITYIEIQIPFSDPIADGEIIRQANDSALQNGMTTGHTFDMIDQARQKGLQLPLYVMTYLQKIQAVGYQKFFDRALQLRLSGVIVPDLPFDSPDSAELAPYLERSNVKLVPVVSPGMPAGRLTAILETKPEQLYITSQRGITGAAFNNSQSLRQCVADIRRMSDAELLLGFGIASNKDVQAALEIADVAVVGSAVIRQLQAGGVAQANHFIASLAGAD